MIESYQTSESSHGSSVGALIIGNDNINNGLFQDRLGVFNIKAFEVLPKEQGNNAGLTEFLLMSKLKKIMDKYSDQIKI
jgi:hypothetical protein